MKKIDKEVREDLIREAINLSYAVSTLISSQGINWQNWTPEWKKVIDLNEKLGGSIEYLDEMFDKVVSEAVFDNMQELEKKRKIDKK